MLRKFWNIFRSWWTSIVGDLLHWIQSRSSSSLVAPSRSESHCSSRLNNQPYEAVTGIPLRQGDILSGVFSVGFNSQTIQDFFAEKDFSKRSPGVELQPFPYAVVMSQDCDLARAFTDNADPANLKNLRNVILCALEEEDKFRIAADIRGDLKKRFIQNEDQRYQFIAAVPKELDSETIGIPALGADFRVHFTLPSELLFWGIKAGEIKRRVKLQVPFAEHLTTRFFSYLGRIALPIDHHRINP